VIVTKRAAIREKKPPKPLLVRREKGEGKGWKSSGFLKRKVIEKRPVA